MVTRPAMWGQIPALFAKKVAAQTSKKRVRANDLLGNHPGKRAHIRQNQRILFPRMGFEDTLPSDARSAQYRQSFNMKNRSKVHVSVHSSSTAHCNRRGVDSALQPTWRGSPRADCGENGLVGCAGELPAFCLAAANAATLPLRPWCAAETPTPCALPYPPNPPPEGWGGRVRAAHSPSLGPTSTPLTQRHCSPPSGESAAARHVTVVRHLTPSLHTLSLFSLSLLSLSLSPLSPPVV